MPLYVPVMVKLNISKVGWLLMGVPKNGIDYGETFSPSCYMVCNTSPTGVCINHAGPSNGAITAFLNRELNEAILVYIHVYRNVLAMLYLERST